GEHRACVGRHHDHPPGLEQSLGLLDQPSLRVGGVDFKALGHSQGTMEGLAIRLSAGETLELRPIVPDRGDPRGKALDSAKIMTTFIGAMKIRPARSE
ncbi:MAG: hypothetical protein RLZ51_1716, partial [Pseudomonadota bacterium]